jgi:esterase/lipase
MRTRSWQSMRRRKGLREVITRSAFQEGGKNMTFREIDEAMMNLVDEETGEILDLQEFEKLAMSKQDKIENMALWVLDLKDESEQINAEIQRLKDRKAATDNKMKRLKEYIRIILGGEKLRTPLVSVSFRSNESVNITDAEAVINWVQHYNKDDGVLKYLPPEISKTGIKQLIKEGSTIPGVSLENTTSTIIK